MKRQALKSRAFSVLFAAGFDPPRCRPDRIFEPSVLKPLSKRSTAAYRQTGWSDWRNLMIAPSAYNWDIFMSDKFADEDRAMWIEPQITALEIDETQNFPVFGSDGSPLPDCTRS